MGISKIKASIKKIEIINKVTNEDWDQSIRIVLGDIELNDENLIELKKFRPNEAVNVSFQSQQLSLLGLLEESVAPASEVQANQALVAPVAPASEVQANQALVAPVAQGPGPITPFQTKKAKGAQGTPPPKEAQPDYEDLSSDPQEEGEPLDLFLLEDYPEPDPRDIVREFIF